MKQKSISFVLAMFAAGAIYSQDITINYNEDGSALMNSFSSKGNSFWVLNDNKLTHEEFLFPNGKRRMWSSYVYDDNYIIEKQDFIYTQGREKETMEYDHFGNVVKYEEFDFISGNNWKSVYKRTEKYDAYNNPVHFTSVGYSASEYINLEHSTTYDYPNEKRFVKRIERDKSGRIISNYTSTNQYPQNIIDERAKYGKEENQWNRIKRTSKKDHSGNTVVTIETEENKSIQTFNRNGRLIEHQLFRGLGRNRYKINYEPYYRFKFKYDKSGRVIQQNMIYEVRGRKEWKSVYGFSSNGKLIKESVYRLTDSGGWKYVELKKHNNLEPIFTPKLDKSSLIKTPELPDAVSETPVVHGATATPVASSTTLVDQLNNDSEESDLKTTNMYDSDLKKLEHLVRVMNSQSDTDVSEADVLRLALQLLIDEHRDEIKDSNQAFLEEQSTMFD